MSRSITKSSRTYRLSGPVAAGVDGAFVALTEIDTQGYNAVRVLFVIGTVVATGVLTSRLKNYATAGAPSAVGSTVGVVSSPVTGIPTVASDQDGLSMHNLWNPRHRYITVEYRRTIANVLIDAVIVELYRADDEPVTQAGTDVHASEELNDPLPSAV